jgi:hypothetical protein
MARLSLFPETGDVPSRDATMQRISDGDGLRPAAGADLSTPIVSTQDGPRTMGKGISNFGGKKAAPFKKGGGRKTKAVVAKAAVMGAKYGKGK